MVPKRHAKRAVTRNLIKRQMREVMKATAAELPRGLWVLRLKSVFDPKQFQSPASLRLRDAARDEIALLLRRAARPSSSAAQSAVRDRHAQPVAPDLGTMPSTP